MYYFYVSTIAGLLKGCPGEISNVSNAFLVNADLLQSSGHFFLNFTKCYFATETWALIHWYKI